MHLDLTKARFCVHAAKTEVGTHDVEIHCGFLSELKLYQDQLGTSEIVEPACPTRTEIRLGPKQPPIHLRVALTFRRTYITYMLAGGHDIPTCSRAATKTPGSTLGI